MTKRTFGVFDRNAAVRYARPEPKTPRTIETPRIFHHTTMNRNGYPVRLFCPSQKQTDRPLMKTSVPIMQDVGARSRDFFLSVRDERSRSGRTSSSPSSPSCSGRGARRDPLAMREHSPLCHGMNPDESTPGAAFRVIHASRTTGGVVIGARGKELFFTSRPATASNKEKSCFDAGGMQKSICLSRPATQPYFLAKKC